MSHQNFMSLALQLAEKGRLTVSPNPMVGCIIVRNNQIIGQGYHRQAGHPHAEIYALDDVAQTENVSLQDAIAYVSLEPCCHHGRTPPCTQALIQSGIKKVYVACLDPNPLVQGKGVAELRAHGIDVEVGLCETEAKQLNEIFFHYIQHKKPFVIAKWAMSLDGKTVTHALDDRHITTAETQIIAHQNRQQVDAILVGAKTVIRDNPFLTVRSNNASKQPLRIVLTGSGNLPLHLNIFNDDLAHKTLVVTKENVDPTVISALQKKQIDILFIQEKSTGEIDLSALLLELGKRGITSVLVEGGMFTHHQFFNENLVNRTHVYVAPLIIGEFTKKKSLLNLQLQQLHGDYFFSADLASLGDANV